MRRSRQKLPQEEQRRFKPRDGSCDIRGGVSHAEGEDCHVCGSRKERWGERQDSFPVGGCALGEDYDYPIRVSFCERVKVGESSRGCSIQLRRRQSQTHCRKQGNLSNLARARIANSEDRIENRSQIKRVYGGSEIRSDDRARVGHARGGLLREGAALDTVELEVDPPDAGDGKKGPEEEFAEYGREREVLEEQEVEEGVAEEDGEAEEEEECAREGGG